jgi:RNA polymerase sigma-70 factor (ECF subfamily)
MQNDELAPFEQTLEATPTSPILFEIEMGPHLDSLYRNALRLTGNRNDAEDLLQDTYLRAFRFFHQRQTRTNAKAWLFRIMNRLFIDQYRKKARRGEQMSYDNVEEFYLYNRFSEGTLSSAQTFNISNPEDLIVEKIGIEAIQTAISRLPDAFKETVGLAIENFSYQEISDIVQAPMGTVRSRISRGRKLLQRALWEHLAKKKPKTGSLRRVPFCSDASH